MKIGIRIDNFVFGTKFGEEVEVALSYNEIREIAQMAESGGLDSIWLSDHLIYRFDNDVIYGSWECWTLLTALAEATKKVELGTVVICNSFRNPALLAKMAHTLDEISGGRLILGLGAGWHKPEFDAFGYPFDHRVDRFEEALQILSPLLKGKGVDFVGKHYQARDCVISPLGPRPTGIPLLVGAHGPRMLRLTARYADMWNKAWLGDVEDFNEPLTQIQQACLEEGRDPDTLALTANVSVIFPEIGEPLPFAANPLQGTVESLAQAFQRYEKAGIAHIIIQYTPRTLQGLARLIEAVAFYHEMES
jgi:probable F420-dependent oxidoreductase